MACLSTSSGSGGSATGGNGGTGGSGTGGAVSTGGNTGSGGAAAGTSGSTGGNSGTGGGSGGTNLLANGDFSQSDTNWHFENGTATVADGQYCETNITGSNALFGWQNTATPLALSSGKSYTLSYNASGSGGAVLHVKVAHAVSPYTPDDYETNPDDSLGGNFQLQTFTHTFMPGNGADDNTGVTFFVMSGQNICLSSVSLVAN
jgi:hypothetical protein